MNRIIKDPEGMYEDYISLNNEKFLLPIEANGTLEFNWKESLLVTTPFIQNLLDEGTIIGYLVFDNNRSGYYKCVPFNTKKFKIYKNELRGVLRISFVGIATDAIKVPTKFERTNLFPKDSLVIENTTATDICINILDTPKALSNSVVYVEHDDSLQKDYQIEYDRNNEKGELVIKVKNIEIKEELNRVANNYVYTKRKNSLDALAFSASIWYPLILEILTHAYEVEEMEDLLWYNSFQQLGLINDELKSTYKNIDLQSERLVLIQNRVNNLLFSIDNNAWTLPIFLRKFKLTR